MDIHFVELLSRQYTIILISFVKWEKSEERHENERKKKNCALLSFFLSLTLYSLISLYILSLFYYNKYQIRRRPLDLWNCRHEFIDGVGMEDSDVHVGLCPLSYDTSHYPGIQ